MIDFNARVDDIYVLVLSSGFVVIVLPFAKTYSSIRTFLRNKSEMANGGGIYLDRGKFH